MEKSKGNMYDFVTGTKNFIRGECYHKCGYCYVKSSRVKKLYEGPPKLIESQFKSLGKDKFWFIGSMIDMWADLIPSYSIMKILEHCRKYKNRYLFQSKNPWRFDDFRTDFPPNVILGTTIETSRVYRQMGNTPSTESRSRAMAHLSENFETMVTIEPIMDFSLEFLVHHISACNPSWVNIGADSKKHNLPEPPAEKIKELISELRSSGIEVKIKKNLRRLGIFED